MTGFKLPYSVHSVLSLWFLMAGMLICLDPVAAAPQKPFPLANPGPVAKKITPSNGGRPFGLVFSALQDSKGNIWLGTDNGLVRFDGMSQRRFLPDDEQVNGLPHRRVASFA